MAVYQGEKTKDGRSWIFRTYYTDLSGNRKQYKSQKYATKKEALESERAFLLNKTDKLQSNNLTFKDLINDYLIFQKDKVKITSYNNYHKSVNLLEDLSSIKVDEFRLSQFNQWKEKLNSTNYSTVYKNNTYKFLRAVMNYGIKYHDLNLPILNKLTGFDNPNELKKEMKFYTYEEYVKFISKVDELKYKTYFQTLYYMGLRKEEANALNWNDIDFENETIRINKSLSMKIKGQTYVILPPKTKNSIRILPMPKVLKNALKSLYNDYSKYENFDKSWFVFGGIFPLADTTIDKKKKLACKLSGVKEIRIHDFRHSTASLLINNGASITLVAKYLGHSNITTTLNTYTHLFKNELNDIVNMINKLD